MLDIHSSDSYAGGRNMRTNRTSQSRKLCKKKKRFKVIKREEWRKYLSAIILYRDKARNDIARLFEEYYGCE